MKHLEGSQKFIFVFLLIVLICFFYLGAHSTYTAYESEIEGKANASTAGIHILLNGYDVVANNGVLDSRLLLDNTTWVSTHTREEKISPGSHGTIHLDLDASGSEVAILYEFQFIDKLMDEDKLINFGDIQSDHEFIRTAEDTYSGVLTLNQIESGDIVGIDVDFYFDYLVDIEGITEDNQTYDDLFEIYFHAVQYRGEELVPYTD